MKKIIILCIIAVIVCTGVWFFRDKTLLRTASGWELYNTNCRELLNDDGETARIYSSFGLGRMKKLKTLEAKSIDDYDFLKELDELENLNVSANENHPLDISKFPKVSSLKKLIIHNGDGIEACTDGISDKFPELEIVWFFGGHISDKNIQDISQCPELKSLYFWGFDRQPFDLYPLTKANDLEELYLPDVFPKMELAPLSEMSGLKILECTVYNEEDIKATSNLSSLKELSIYGCNELLDKDEKLRLPDDYFNGLKSLEEITAKHFVIGDEFDVSSLPPDLKKITLYDCDMSENVKRKLSASGIEIEVNDKSRN